MRLFENKFLMKIVDGNVVKTDLRDLSETELKCNIAYAYKNEYTEPYEFLKDEKELLEFGAFVQFPEIESIIVYFSPEDMKQIIKDEKESIGRKSDFIHGYGYPVTRLFRKMIHELNVYNASRVKYSYDPSLADVEKIL